MKHFKQVMEITALGILINENTEYCTFVDFSGHVKHINIRIFPNKEAELNEKLHDFNIYYDSDFTSRMTEEKILLGFENAKEILSKYLFGLDNLMPEGL